MGNKFCFAFKRNITIITFIKRKFTSKSYKITWYAKINFLCTPVKLTAFN